MTRSAPAPGGCAWIAPRGYDHRRPLCVHVGLDGTGTSRYAPHLRGCNVVLLETAAALREFRLLGGPGWPGGPRPLKAQGFTAVVEVEDFRDPEHLWRRMREAGLPVAHPKRGSLAILENHHRGLAAADEIGARLGAPRRYDPSDDFSKHGQHRLCDRLGLPAPGFAALDSLDDSAVAAAHRGMGAPARIMIKASNSANSLGIVSATAETLGRVTAELRGLRDYDGASLDFILEEMMDRGRYAEGCLMGEFDESGRARPYVYSKLLSGLHEGRPVWFGEAIYPFGIRHERAAALSGALASGYRLAGTPFFTQFWIDRDDPSRLLLGEMDPRKRGVDFGLEPLLAGTTLARQAILRQRRRPYRPVRVNPVVVGLTAMRRERLPAVLAMARRAFPELVLATEFSGPWSEAGSGNVRLRATSRRGDRIEAFLLAAARETMEERVSLGGF